MVERNLHCTVTAPETESVYDVDAYYRDTCSRGHDAREEHLCDLTLRLSPMNEPNALFTVCDLATVPTPVLVAIQGRLRTLLASASSAALVATQRPGQILLSTSRR